MKKILLKLLCLSLLFTACKKDDETSTINMNNTNLSIGDIYQGGVIFYLDITGQHGFVCDFKDLGIAEWGCHDTIITGADETEIGKGYQNTIDVETGCTMPNTAADYCANSSAQGYSDWFLPSKDELNQMYLHKTTIQLTDGVTAFSTTYYWSSSESNSKHDYDPAWGQYFSNGFQYGYDKSSSYSVRAIRAF
jgi:hypothetical protein